MTRKETKVINIGERKIGGGNPVAIQSMTNTKTEDVESTVAQILALEKAGCEIIRCAVPNMEAAQALQEIKKQIHIPLVADIHFDYRLAIAAIENGADKIRINPGNIGSEDRVRAVVEKAKEYEIPIRVGVNSGSLEKNLLEKYGGVTAEGIVESALDKVHMIENMGYDNLVVSIKSSDVMMCVKAHELIAKKCPYQLHVGITESGTLYSGNIKSAVGLGIILYQGIGDTIRVSLTEAPEHEIPVAELLVRHFAERPGTFPVLHPERYSPTEYRRRTNIQVPVVHSEPLDGFRVIEAVSGNPTAELRAAILNLDTPEPVVVKRRYEETSPEALAVKAAADLGVLLLDGLADGIWIDAPGFAEDQVREIELMILQAARVRFSHTEYIACPSCGRTLYDIEKTLADIKSRTSHLSNLKIGVMGCIVNGPGEMADADYGYVGAAPGRITLYKGRTVVARNIPQQEALDRLVELIKADGEWVEP